MVMNIFDTEFNPASAVTKTSAEPLCSDDTFSFDYMFNTNSFFGTNISEGNSFFEKPNDLLTQNSGNGNDHDAFGSNIQSYKAIQQDSMFGRGSVFDDEKPSSWNTQWSNGESSVNQAYTLHDLPTSCFGIPDSQNSLLSKSPQQSRIIGFIGATSPSTSLSPTHNIESMKIRDFLSHQTGTLRSVSTPPGDVARSGDVMGERRGGDVRPKSEYLFTDSILNTPLQSLSVYEKKHSLDESANTTWDNLDANVSLSSSAPNPTLNPSLRLASSPPLAPTQRNAWSKPLKFDEANSRIPSLKSKTSSSAHASGPPRKSSVPSSNPIQPYPNVVPTPCIGKRVSELDDFVSAPSLGYLHSAPSRQSSKVRPGGFQVVASKKSKGTKFPGFPGAREANTGAREANTISPQPLVTSNKCGYGSKCTFGRECSRWHSSNDQHEFIKQKMPNGSRKCPWGSKCFRKLKCANFHSKEEVELFKL